jgi:hypothetical protein
MIISDGTVLIVVVVTTCPMGCIVNWISSPLLTVEKQRLMTAIAMKWLTLFIMFECSKEP